MATTAAPSQLPPKKLETEEDVVVKIRIVLTSLNVQALERVCADLKRGAQDKQQKVKGPVRLPTRRLTLTVRQSPCGNGTQTFDRMEMRIHKRIFDLVSPTSIMKQITDIPIEPGVNVEVFFNEV